MNIFHRVLIFFLMAIGLFILPAMGRAETKQIIINEIFYNPIGTDTGLEWIELYNPNSTPVDLSEWNLDPSSASYYTFPTFTLSPDSYVIIHINSNSENTITDLYVYPSSNMSNTAGPIALFNSSERVTNNLIDYMEYGAGGQTNESKAVSAGLWTAGEYTPNANEGKSLAYKGSGNGATNWQESDPTPGAANSQSTSPPDDDQTPPNEEEEPNPPTGGETGGIGPGFLFLPRDVLINELVSDPGDGEAEWIELIKQLRPGNQSWRMGN